ncbi:sugar transferase [Ovoidimarina sediminis]|uniref:sugar transferase n=1 Tax=Ovoidimarina sediminis TaxID=3079856 RepID=UPI002908DC69|nr:sugar transferase [Rhodophyticola sp. MJ-SS7]MDU8945248.1 sugar transferase [Rhodophyticola sp. MJ-SS7]
MKKVSIPGGGEIQSASVIDLLSGRSAAASDAQNRLPIVTEAKSANALAGPLTSRATGAVKVADPATLPENPGRAAKLGLAGAIIFASGTAALVSAVFSGCVAAGMGTLWTAVAIAALYSTATLLHLIVFGEFRSTGLGDTPSRLIGVVEASILAWFPTLLVLLIVSQTIVGPLPWFVALLGPLSVLLNGIAAWLVTSRLTSTGERVGLILFDRATEDDLPGLPVGKHSFTRRVHVTSGWSDIATKAMAEAVRDGQVDQILVVAPQHAASGALAVVTDLNMFDLPVWYAPPKARPSQLMRLRSPMNSRIREAMKRSVDVVISLLAITLMFVPCLIVGILIWLEDRGPIFFTQPRVGRNQVPFRMLKFRSMRYDLSDERGDQLTTTNDDRVTRIGAFMRKTSFDELPQFINVLKGEMSIVGPRPLVVGFHFKGHPFAEIIPDFNYRSRVRPGVTGLSQLRGLRGTPDTFEDACEMMNERTVCDNDYIERWTIWLDLKIIVMTVLSGAFVSKAY